MKPTTIRRWTYVSMLTAALNLGSSVGAAEVASPPHKASAASVNDDDLRAFAKAYVEFHKVKQKYEARMAAATESTEKQRLLDQSNAEIDQALRRQGLSQARYRELFALVNGNNEIRQRALSLIKEQRQHAPTQ